MLQTFNKVLIFSEFLLKPVKHYLLVSSPFEIAIRLKWSRNSLKPITIRFFRFARQLANHVTLVKTYTLY